MTSTAEALVADVEEDEAPESVAVASDDDGGDDGEATGRRRPRLARIVVYGILPGLALLFAAAAGYLKWVDATARDAEVARTQSVQAAVDTTAATSTSRPPTATPTPA